MYCHLYDYTLPSPPFTRTRNIRSTDVPSSVLGVGFRWKTSDITWGSVSSLDPKNIPNPTTVKTLRRFDWKTRACLQLLSYNSLTVNNANLCWMNHLPSWNQCFCWRKQNTLKNSFLWMRESWMMGWICENWKNRTEIYLWFGSILPETNSSPLKMDGWKTILSFWDGQFSGAMLVSGTVYSCFLLVVSIHLKHSSQLESYPQVRVKIKNLWNHHPVLVFFLWYTLFIQLSN